MSTVLIFPPGVDPRGPHLALPSLAAWLRAHGETVTMIDLNIEAVHALLQPNRLSRAGGQLRRRANARDPATVEGRMALSSARLTDLAAGALDTLRDRSRFFDAHAFNSARQLVVAALDLASSGFHPDVSFNINPARYNVKDCDPRSLTDLLSCCANDERNLFADLWQASLDPRLAALAPELVGISITNRQQLIPGLMLARRLRSAGYFTVIGGTVLSKFAERLRQRPEFFSHFADAVIPYEGETAMLMLLAQLRGAGDLSRVPNLLYPEGDSVAASFTRVEDINRLPTPDFEGLDLGAYLAPYPVLPILTGKGCYFNRCRFCDIPYINHISRKAYRVRSAETIVADVNRLYERFGCRHFVITDEALSPRLLDKLAARLKPWQARRYRFTGYARLEPGFTTEACADIAGMGMVKLYFGLESADQATLDHMDKGTRVTQAPAVLRHCDQAGIRFHLFSIIGFPQETEASARRTLAFFVDHRALIDHPGNSFDIHPFGLELRTDYFRNREDYGIDVDARVLSLDFVIGLDGSDWRNPSGLSGERVEQLLTKEFQPALRHSFRRYHATAEGLWPGFEEYAVLYGDHYAERDFPFCSSLADQTEETTFEFNWSEAVTRLDHAEWTLMLQHDSWQLLRKAFVECLGRRNVRRIDDALARELLGPSRGRADLVACLDRLIAGGWLQARVFTAQPA